MKISCLLSFVLLGMSCGGRQEQLEDTSNRSYFTIHSEDRKLTIPVQLNDSVTVKLMFDTGAGMPYNFGCITLDTGILCASNVEKKTIPITFFSNNLLLRRLRVCFMSFLGRITVKFRYNLKILFMGSK